MEPKNSNEKIKGTGVREMTGGAYDLLSKTTDREGGFKGDKMKIGQMTAAAVAVALDIYLSSGVSAER